MTKRAENSLRLENVSIHLNGKELLSVNQEIKPGSVLSIMGPSGSGKSSLLAYVAGFLDPTFKASGRVVIADQNIIDMPASERRMGMLFQDALLFPHMSVGQNLAFSISPQISHEKAERLALINEALENAGLPDYFDRDPATLSGGQKARIALMRVLLARPRALLLDEPFSKLDAELRDQIRNFVFTQAEKQNLPVLLVTHDENDVRAAKGDVITL